MSALRRVARRIVPGPLAGKLMHRLRWPRARDEYLARFAPDRLNRYLAEIDSFWRSHYGRPISPIDHLRFTALTGVHDPRFVPGRIWWLEALPHLNDLGKAAVFDDKNLADRFLPAEVLPRLIVKRVRGRYYAPQDLPLQRGEAWERIAAETAPLIAKPADTNNGEGITALDTPGDGVLLDGQPVGLNDLEVKLGSDFLVQERIVQHEAIGRVHPASVNTLRMITLRRGGDIHHLGTFARFGLGGGVTDNAGTGGVFVGVDGEGRLHPAAFDKTGATFTHHPTSGAPFAGVQVPNFPVLVSFVQNLHEPILPLDLISWDVAVGQDGDPILLELNFRGAGELYQWALGRSVFGEHTAAVLESIAGG